MSYPGLGGVVAIGVAGYLGAVIFHGNANKLLDALKGELGFIKWGAALLLFWLVMSRLKGGIGFEIGLLAVLGLALIVGDKFFSGFSNIFKGA